MVESALSTSEEAWLAEVTSQTWLLTFPHRLVQASRDDNGDFVFGDIRLTTGQLLSCRPPDYAPGAPIRSFIAMHRNWRVAEFHAFRPLAYFAAFGTDEVLAMLDTAIRSLLTAGKWRWDIAVLTAPDQVAALEARLAKHGCGDRLRVVPFSPNADLVDWCLSRFRAISLPMFEPYQPILYLDVDVVCDLPIDFLLVALAQSRSVHFCREGRLDEGVGAQACNWFGYPLLLADQVDVDPLSAGFSAGIMGFANRDLMHRAFDLVSRSVEGYEAEVGQRSPFAGTDQSFAGYVLRKLGLADLSLLHQVVQLIRIKPQAPAIPDPARARGLAHFLAAPYALRAEVMGRYLDAVLARSRDDTQNRE